MPAFSARSQTNLMTCHPDLQRLFNEVIKTFDCTIICGHRIEKEQLQAFVDGHSRVQWPNSWHNQSPSRAVDVAPYPIDWKDLRKFHRFAGFVTGTAKQMGIKITWGGDFKTFFDGPHFELINE